MPPTVESRSLVPVLDGRVAEIYPEVYAYWHRAEYTAELPIQRMVRTARWNSGRPRSPERTTSAAETRTLGIQVGDFVAFDPRVETGPAGYIRSRHLDDKAAVDRILPHPDIAAVSFVGSTPIAKYIYETCAKHGKRVQALGGAKNHAVVLPDADLEFAAEALTGAAYGSAGERCMAISAVVAVGAAADPLVRLLERKAKAIKLGVDMGPLVTGQHRDKVASYIEKGVQEGAKLVVDARTQERPKEGFYLGTSLFDHVKPEMEIYRNEIFGPVLVVLRVGTLEEAIALINKNPYANGTAIFTESGGAARRFENEIQGGSGPDTIYLRASFSSVKGGAGS